jgi:3-oxoacyl-ACP reductase-like protein
MSAASARPAVATPAPAAPAAAAPTEHPTEKSLVNAAKLAITQDKPILLDYYRETKAGTAFLGEDKDTKEQILFKNAEEYTSPIQNKYRVVSGDQTEYIFITENSIYIVHGAIKKKEISAAF